MAKGALMQSDDRTYARTMAFSSFPYRRFPWLVDLSLPLRPPLVMANLDALQLGPIRGRQAGKKTQSCVGATASITAHEYSYSTNASLASLGLGASTCEKAMRSIAATALEGQSKWISDTRKVCLENDPASMGRSVERRLNHPNTRGMVALPQSRKIVGTNNSVILGPDTAYYFSAGAGPGNPKVPISLSVIAITYPGSPSSYCRAMDYGTNILDR